MADMWGTDMFDKKELSTLFHALFPQPCSSFSFVTKKQMHTKPFKTMSFHLQV